MHSYIERRKQEIEFELKRTNHTDIKYLSLKIEILFINSKDFYNKIKDSILGPLV